MAEIKTELATLKIRASKKEGAQKITIVDHAAKTRQTCTVAEGVALLAGKASNGQSERVIHIVDHAAEKKRKLTNPSKTTKKIFNCRTPEQWTELNAALEPFYEEAVDPHIAIDLIIRALRCVPRETIRELVRQGHEDRQGPPPAEPLPGAEWFDEEKAEYGDLPDYLKP